MRIKFGSLVTEGTGSLGGHTFQNSNYGAQLRSKPVNKKAPSFSQSLIRSYNSTIHGGWRALTDAQRNIWIKAAPYPLSGSQFWYQCQYTRLAEGLPFLNNPANKLDTYLGEELVDQDLWNAPGLAYWDIVNGNWYADGSCLYFNDSLGSIFKLAFWSIGTLYKVKLSVNINGYRLIPPYNGSSPYFDIISSNTYTFFYTVVGYSRMILYAQNVPSFISSLSIKEVFNYNG